MKFNIKNYEEYALDYLQGELKDADQAEFGAFLLLNPEIQEELEAFEMVTISPDLEEVYPRKQDLFRKVEGNYYRVIAGLVVLFAVIVLAFQTTSETDIDGSLVSKVNAPEIIPALEEASSENKAKLAASQALATPQAASAEESVAPTGDQQTIGKSINARVKKMENPTKVVNKPSPDFVASDLRGQIQEQNSEPSMEVAPSRSERVKWVSPLVQLRRPKQIRHQRAVEKIEVIHPALLRAFSGDAEKASDAHSKVGKWLTHVNLVPSTFANPERSEIKNKLLPTYFSAE